jgi:hypothetical protein
MRCMACILNYFIPPEHEGKGDFSQIIVKTKDEHSNETSAHPLLIWKVYPANNDDFHDASHAWQMERRTVAFLK